MSIRSNSDASTEDLAHAVHPQSAGHPERASWGNGDGRGPTVKRKRPGSAQQPGDGDGQAPNGAPIAVPNPTNYPRKRVAVACEICRVRKTRCDAARPSCSFCSQLGVQCTYRKPVQQNENKSNYSTTQQSPLAALSGRIDQLEAQNQQLKAELAEAGRIHRPAESVSAFPIGAPGAENSFTSPELNFSAPFPAELPRHPDVADSSFHAPSQETPGFPVLGLRIAGHSRLKGYPPPPELYPLTYDDSEEYLAREIEQGNQIYQTPVNEDLDLTPRTCRILHQTFAQKVLPWFPIFDQSYSYNELVSLLINEGLEPRSIRKCSALFILALGAFAKDRDDPFGDTAADFPGLDYWNLARRVTDIALTYSVDMIHAWILRALYLLYALRPIQAYDAVEFASSAVVAMLHLKTRLREDRRFRECCHRAYWTCYMLQHELRPHVARSTQVIGGFHEAIPLPQTLVDEPGMFWFSSEIHLRKVFTHVMGNIHLPGSDDSHTIYQPIVSNELCLELNEWFERLPPAVNFGEGIEALSDERKAFLRTQFHAAHAVKYWSAILRLLTESAGPLPEHELSKVNASAKESIQYMVNYIFCSESLLEGRHQMLFANILGTFCLTMMLLCVINVQSLAPAIQAASPQPVAAVRKARELLSYWSANPGVAACVTRIERLMVEKGVSIDRPRAQSAGNTPSTVSTISSVYTPNNTSAGVLEQPKELPMALPGNRQILIQDPGLQRGFPESFMRGAVQTPLWASPGPGVAQMSPPGPRNDLPPHWATKHE